MWDAPGPYTYSVNLYVCDDEVPPEYDGKDCEPIVPSRLISALVVQGTLKINLRDLPKAAIYKRKGPSGPYYGVSYDIGLVFGAGGIEFRFLYDNKIAGAIECDYA